MLVTVCAKPAPAYNWIDKENEGAGQNKGMVHPYRPNHPQQMQKGPVTAHDYIHYFSPPSNRRDGLSSVMLRQCCAMSCY